MLRAAAFVLLLLAAGAAAAQDMDPALAAALGPAPVASYWLPDPANREAVGVTYTEIEGAAGNVNINVGYFAGGPQAFALAGPVLELYGEDPRDPRFLEDRIELTTTMPNPGDPRCCPTGTAVWSIDRNTLAARRIQ